MSVKPFAFNVFLLSLQSYIFLLMYPIVKKQDHAPQDMITSVLPRKKHHCMLSLGHSLRSKVHLISWSTRSWTLSAEPLCTYLDIPTDMSYWIASRSQAVETWAVASGSWGVHSLMTVSWTGWRNFLFAGSLSCLLLLFLLFSPNVFLWIGDPLTGMELRTKCRWYREVSRPRFSTCPGSNKECFSA